MEIERKFLVDEMPAGLADYRCCHIEQAYLSFDPEVRIRRQNDTFYLTEKSGGALVREEHENEIQNRTMMRKCAAFNPIS